MKKSLLRKIYLEKQQSLSQDERENKSLAVRDGFFSRLDLSGVSKLHFFHPIEEKNEIKTSFIVKDLWRRKPEMLTVAPRVSFKNDALEHLVVNRETRLETNKWGIPEPVGDVLVPEVEIDMVLVPLLCFDRNGYRVGYGKGFYDRFLALCRRDCVKVGLSFFGPVEEIEDIGDHDVGLDVCVTPRTTHKF